MAGNNHYRGYGPGTVDIFRENMDMNTVSFENEILLRQTGIWNQRLGSRSMMESKLKKGSKQSY